MTHVTPSTDTDGETESNVFYACFICMDTFDSVAFMDGHTYTIVDNSGCVSDAFPTERDAYEFARAYADDNGCIVHIGFFDETLWTDEFDSYGEIRYRLSVHPDALTQTIRADGRLVPLYPHIAYTSLRTDAPKTEIVPDDSGLIATDDPDADASLSYDDRRAFVTIYASAIAPILEFDYADARLSARSLSAKFQTIATIYITEDDDYADGSCTIPIARYDNGRLTHVQSPM